MSKSRKKMMTRVREFAVLSGQDPIMSFYCPMWGAIYDVESSLSAEGSGPPGKRTTCDNELLQFYEEIYNFKCSMAVEYRLSAEGSGPPGLRTSRIADLLRCRSPGVRPHDCTFIAFRCRSLAVSQIITFILSLPISRFWTVWKSRPLLPATGWSSCFVGSWG